MATRTIQSSGGDYTSLSAWEAALSGTLSEQEIAECYDLSDTTKVTVNVTTSASNDIIIRGVSPIAPLWSTSKYRLEVSDFNEAIQIASGHVTLKHLQISQTRSSSADSPTARGILLAGPNSCVHVVDACIIRQVNNPSAGRGISCTTTNTGKTIVIRNCLFYDQIQTAVHVQGRASDTFLIYNNTIHNAGGNGFYYFGANSGDTLRLKNNIVQDTTGTHYNSDGSTWATTDILTNLSGDSSGTSGLTTKTVLFENEGGDDFHLSASDTSGALSGGTNLSAVGSGQYQFSVDMENESRSDWDLGCDEIVSAGNVTVEPSTQVVSVVQPAPTVSTSGNITVSAGVQSITSSQPTPTVSTGGNVSVSLSVLVITAEQQAPTAQTTEASGDSSLFNEMSIDVVAITLNRKDGSGSDTFYLGTDHYCSDSIYSGSPTIYPLLVEPPQVRRGVGLHVSIRYDVQIRLFGKTHFQTVGKSFLDLLDTYEFHHSLVEFRYYNKALGSTTTHDADVNIRQQTEIIDLSYNPENGELTLFTRDTWKVKDGIFNRYFRASDFALNGDADLDSRFEGQVSAWPIGDSNTNGQGIIFSAPIINSEVASDAPKLKLFAGNKPRNKPLGTFTGIYVKNKHKQIKDVDWMEMHVITDPDTPRIGNSSLSSTTDRSLAARSWGRIFQTPSGKAEVVTKVRCYLNKSGTVTADTGEIKVEIHEAEYLPTSDTYQPKGSALGSAKLDPAWSAIQSGTTTADFQIPAVTCHPDVIYFVSLTWSNTTDTTNYLYTRTKTTASTHSYSRDNSQRDKGWTKQADTELAMAIYALGQDTGYDNGGTTDDYANFSLKSNAVVFASGDAVSELNDVGLEFKLNLDTGILDDSSGTHTGIVNGAVRNPADLIHLFLNDNQGFGLALGSGSINTTSFTTARTKLDSDNIRFAFALDEQRSSNDFLLDICRQSKLVLYKDKRGRMAVHYPQYLLQSPTATLAEVKLRDDIQVISVDDNDHGSVINDLDQFYQPNALNVSTDPVDNRKQRTERYLSREYINQLSSKNSDTTREQLAAASVALYDRREHRANLDFIDSSTQARKIQEYYFDRFHKLQKRFTVRLLRKNYFNLLDLFSTIELQATPLPASVGTYDYVDTHQSDTPRYVVNEGVTGISWSGGGLKGIIYEVREVGEFIEVIGETVSVFNYVA